MEWNRRTFLINAGVAGLAGQSGCLGIGDDTDDDAGDDENDDRGDTPIDGTATTTQAGEDTATAEETPAKVPISEVSGVPILGYNPSRQSFTADGYGPVSGFNNRWKQRLYPSGAVAPPVLMNGQVYTAPMSSEKPVYALSPTGNKRWSFTPNNATPGQPTIVGETVVVGTSDSAAGTVYGLRAADGSEQWRIETGDHRAGRAPAIVDGTLYFTGANQDDAGSNTLYAYSIADQTRLWTAALESEPKPAPVVVGDTIAVMTRDELVGFDRETGGKRWSAPPMLGGGIRLTYPPAVNGLYLGMQEDSRELVAISARDGSPQWSAGMTAVPLAVGGDFVVAFHLDNRTLLAVSASDGEMRWKADVEFRFPSCAIAGDTLYAAGDEPTEAGKVVTLSLADGTEQARTKFPASAGPPVVADGYVFVPVGNTLFAVEAT